MIGDLRSDLTTDRTGTLKRILSSFKEHLEPHAKWEEEVLYPAVDRRAGSLPQRPFTATMRYEHRVVERWIGELSREASRPKPDLPAFARQADRLLGLV